MRLGIIGGMGSETSCRFCLNVNNRVRQKTGKQPDIVMVNVAMPLEMERGMISGNPSSKVLEMLSQTVIMLNKADVDFIVIPCNTAHVFVDRLRQLSRKPIVSILEETATFCNSRMSRVGLLATTTTIQQELFSKNLESDIILPDDSVQSRITSVIERILNSQSTADDREFLLSIIEDFKREDAQAVILGCTDLSLLLSKACLPIINTLDILEDSAVDIMIRGDLNGG